MAETLHLDLTKSATRKRIVDIIKEHLGEEVWKHIEDTASAAGIPDNHHHGLADVEQAIRQAHLSNRVKKDACSIYRILAEAEASAHGCSVEATHFHEVGEGARIRNAVAICMGIETICPTAITATCVQAGSGTIECAHGTLEVPAPATAAILARGIPVCSERLPGELCTPTSAAIIFHFVDTFV